MKTTYEVRFRFPDGQIGMGETFTNQRQAIAYAKEQIVKARQFYGTTKIQVTIIRVIRKTVYRVTFGKTE